MVIILKVTKVAPVFPIPKARLQEKHPEAEQPARKKAELSFKRVLGNELQRQTGIDIKL
ncbi:MAG: hypothetical protein K0R55_4454 [Sporomusa sp.]|nr:hypothetical protein [Sporomusa sp.]